MPDDAAADPRHHTVTLKTGDRLEGNTYVLVHDHGNVAPRGEAAVPISSGGAGQVFKATSELRLSFAVKVLNPAEGLIKDGSGVFHETFQHEIKLLASLTHTRLSKILDVGKVRDENGDEVPYYVMDFIDGVPFQRFLEETDLSGREFLTLIDQILDGVEYLHSRWVMHCDLKSDNILVQKFEDRGQATIVDLGVAKAIKGDGLPDAAMGAGDDHPPGGDDKTYFNSSEAITREEWRPYLNHRIPRSVLRETLFPSHDLYGIGILIRNALALPALAGRVKEDLGETGVQALEEIVRRLTAPAGEEHYLSPEDRRFSIRSLRRDWQKLDPRHLAPVGVPELAVGAQAKTSVATPRGRVSLTERTLKLVNHPAMQRLRLVPQLELASLVYPGATHTRLLHSLSTFDMARRCVLHLLRDPNFRLMADREEIEALLLMALCHDIGHYPLSHMFEDFAEEDRQKADIADGARIPTDDDLFYAFLDPDSLAGGPFEQCAAILSAGCAREATDPVPFHERAFGQGSFPEKVRAALHRLDACDSPSSQVLRGLINSSIDADKLAYLNDDSALTGVRYGLGIDVDAYLAALRAPSPSDLQLESTAGKAVVALNDKGLPAAESVMLSRYWMLKRVYWHHTNRAAIAMVKYVISELRMRDVFDIADYLEQTLFGGIQEALSLLGASFEEHVEGHVNPIDGLLGGNRWLYKRILTFAKEDGKSRGARLHTSLAFKRSNEAAQVTDLAREVLGGIAGRELSAGEVLLDVPVKERELADSPVLIYPHRSPGAGREISDVSPLIESQQAEFNQHVRKCRLFVHPRLYEELGENLRRARDELEEALTAKFLESR